MTTKNSNKKPQFSFTWLYIGIAAILLFFYVWGDGEGSLVKKVELGYFKGDSLFVNGVIRVGRWAIDPSGGFTIKYV